MRRTAPRPLAPALERALTAAAPPTLLGRVQRCWEQALGDRLAAAATPVAEREGTVTVACGSAVWAHELDLLSSDLVERLNAALGARAVARLRFVTRSGGDS